MSTVLILGAASDMAVALARRFAKEGYDIQLAARSAERLASFQSDLQVRANIKCSVHEFDALEFQQHAAFFESLPVKPDITISVFGLLGENETAVKDWNHAEKIIHSNYTGAVSILNIIANYYEQQKAGVIVGISSVAGERGRQSNYMYGSAKAGFTAYLSGLRNRLYSAGVHVLSVQPGFVNTKMTSDLKLPPLLTAQPEEVADAVFKAVKNKKNTLYVKWFWRYIMLIIRNIPEFIFKKLKL
jgi:decaprenylphospho-beta-D-erythro-pentofuranosid-2-ulose 2-reductase